jgi:hypothetical protein
MVDTVLRPALTLLAVVLLSHPSATLAQSPFVLYLPTVRNFEKPPGIYGVLRNTNQPTGALAVGLARYVVGDTSSTTFIITTTTAADGSFAFPALAAIGANEAYFARWVNTSETRNGLAFAVFTPDIVGFDARAPVVISPIEIGDIGLIEPGPNPPPAGLPLPVTFTWAPRLQAISTDRYRHRLFDQDFNLVTVSADLGTTSHLTWSALPAGVSAGRDYYWDVVATGVDGYEVIGWEARPVRFAAALLLPSAQAVPTLTVRSWPDHPLGQP